MDSYFKNKLNKIWYYTCGWFKTCSILYDVDVY